MDTGIIGPVTDMKVFKASFGGSQNATIHGLIVSSILIPAALSSFFAGYLADRLGRPRGISIGVFIFGVGAAIEAGAVSLGMFIAGRVVEGLGEGLFLGNLVVLICEISPTSTRGPLTTGPQLMITLGLVIGFFTCYGSSNIQSSMSWRTPFILLSSLSMILCVISFFYLPESPRWLTLHGRHREAAETWDKLEVSQAEREKVELQSETAEVVAPVATVTSVKENTVHKLLDIFSKDVRTRTALAVFLMGMQQLSGIDGVLYVCAHIFSLPLFVVFVDLGRLTMILVCSVVVPAGRTCLSRGKLLRIRRLSTRDFCCHNSWVDLCRWLGTQAQHYLRRRGSRRCHVPHRRTIRG
jgi:MFS family permease